MPSSTGRSDKSRFDELFDDAVPSILAGTHLCDEVPQEGGDRWPLTAALLPNRTQHTTRVLEQLLPFAGPHHFLTGSPAAIHLTVRALEHRREHVPPDDPAVSRYLSAISRTAQQFGPLQFRLTGITLTSSGVMAAIEPMDSRPDQLAALLAAELGPDGWREADMKRTIWYSSLLHFTGPIARPADLVAFVADRRHLDLGTITVNRLSLVKFEHSTKPDGSQCMRLDELGAGPLSRT